jgi:hypothetical protein
MRCKRTFVGIALGLFLITAYAAAQDPAPSNVSDLVGARAAGGETQLRNRGYSFVKTQKGADRSYSNCWDLRSSVCITVPTFDGRYDSIVTSPALDCNRSSPSGSPGNQGGFNGGGNPRDAISACQIEARYRMNSDLDGEDTDPV